MDDVCEECIKNGDCFYQIYDIVDECEDAELFDLEEFDNGYPMYPTWMD